MKTWRKYRILAWLLMPLFGIGLAQVARGQVTNGPPYLWWYAPPNTNFMGGLSTNDFFTNVTWVAVSTTNVTIPYTNWPVYFSLPATAFPGYPGPYWTQYIVVDMPFRAFVVYPITGVTNGPPSNVAVAVWSLPQGHLGAGR